MESRDTCIFYRSIFEAIEMLQTDSEKATIYNAIFDYSLNFVEPQLEGTCLMIWKLINPVLEKGNINFINGCRPKKKANEKPTRSETEAKPKRNRSEVEAYKDKDKDKDEDKEKDKIIKQPTFKNWDEEEFKNEIRANKGDYKTEMLQSFFAHFSEKSPNGKMRFQSEKTWETKKRLVKWKLNNYGNSNNKVASQKQPYQPPTEQPRSSQNNINQLNQQ
jgi:hypothetical protein